MLTVEPHFKMVCNMLPIWIHALLSVLQHFSYLLHFVNLYGQALVLW